MLQHILSLARGGVIISPQFSISCTGYQSASEFISRLLAVFSRHWPAKHPPTLPTTATWYQTRTVTDSALPPSDIRTCLTLPPLEHLCDSVSEVFQLLVLKFGTVYRLHSGLRTWRLTVSNEDLRPICLHWCDEISAPSDYWFLALYKYSLCMYMTANIVWDWAADCSRLVVLRRKRSCLQKDQGHFLVVREIG